MGNIGEFKPMRLSNLRQRGEPNLRDQVQNIGKHEPNGEPNESNHDSHEKYGEPIKSISVKPPQSKNIKDLIFNYSSYKLSNPMKALLERALNFSVMPLKLDITEVLVDFNRFARATIWHEY